MGCDIHAHIEYKKGDHWYYFAPASLPRNYALFAHMAGVRNYGEVQPVAPPRGLPESVQEETREDYEGWTGDAHTASWLNYHEFAQAHVLSKGDTLFTSPIVDAWLAAMLVLEGNGYQPRIVFWFDN